MPTHSEQQTLPYTTQQLFDLVADIERYPEFLPWCRAARVLERKEGELLGELVISFSHLTESYTSRVVLARPASGSEPGSIEATMVKGPFEYLVNRWRFTAKAGGLPTPERSLAPLSKSDGTGSGFAQAGTHIDFFLDFKFRSRLLEKLIGSLFNKAAARMVSAFKARAEALYGAAP